MSEGEFKRKILAAYIDEDGHMMHDVSEETFLKIVEEAAAEFPVYEGSATPETSYAEFTAKAQAWQKKWLGEKR